jgi:sortase (surface protein transpeptidase)
MDKKRLGLGLLALQVAVFILSLFGSEGVAAAASNSAWPFMRVWERSDYPVAIGAAQRSWYWGPAPFSFTEEDYATSPGGKRQVAYYDKSRMEITNPESDRESKWYVTNGLLVKEMVSGQIQLGDSQFQSVKAAEIPVSGDGPTENRVSPTYASFAGHLNPALPGNLPVTARLQRDGKIENDPALANRYPETAPAFFEATLGHNIPAVLWKFLNLQGPVLKDRRLVNDKLEDWLFSFGLPLSEAYWTHSTVGGIEREVLVQLFERRVLTYTPGNDPAYQVEMGNVGRHYYNWRYGRTEGQPAPAATFTAPPVHLSIPSIKVDTLIEYVGLTKGNVMDVPLNPRNVGWYRLGAQIGEKGNAVVAGHLDWAGIGPAVFWDLKKLQPGDLVYVFSASGTKQTFRVTETAAYPYNSYPQERVFGESEEAHLILITCNGTFNSASASYDKRLVVYTTLVE